MRNAVSRTSLRIGLLFLIAAAGPFSPARAADALGSYDSTDFQALEDKAEEYLDRVLSMHAPAGQVWNAVLKTSGNRPRSCDDGSYDYEVLDSVSEYGGQGDGAIWTGVYTAALAYRCASLQTDDACDLAKEQVDVLMTMMDVTGIPGVLSRGYEPPEITCAAKSAGTREHCLLESSESTPILSGTGDFADYVYMGNVSRDAYSGWMFGAAVAYDLIDDDAVRARIASHVADFLDHLMENDWKVVQADGEKLVWFEFFNADWGDALMALSHLRTAYQMTGYSRFKEELEDRINAFGYNWLDKAKDWLNGADLSLVNYRCGDFYRFNIGAMPLFQLLRIETGEDLRAAWEEIGDRLWNGNSTFFDGAKNFNHSLYHLIRLLGTVEGAYAFDINDSDSVSDELAADVMNQLSHFPQGPRRRVATDNTPGELASCGDGNYGTEAMTMNARPAADYAWQRSPFRINESCPQPWVEYPGVDYLIAYWLARYSGFFMEPTVEVTTPAAGARYEEGTTARVTVQVAEWIPDSRWTVDEVTLWLYDETSSVYPMSKTVALDTPLTFESPSAIAEFRFPTGLAGSRFHITVGVRATVADASYPHLRTAYAAVDSPSFYVSDPTTVTTADFSDSGELANDSVTSGSGGASEVKAVSFLLNPGQGTYELSISAGSEGVLLVEYYEAGAAADVDGEPLATAAVPISGSTTYAFQNVADDSELLVAIRPSRLAASATFRLQLEGKQIGMLPFNLPDDLGYSGCIDADSEHNPSPGTSEDFLIEVPAAAILAATLEASGRGPYAMSIAAYDEDTGSATGAELASATSPHQGQSGSAFVWNDTSAAKRFVLTVENRSESHAAGFCLRLAPFSENATDSAAGLWDELIDVDTYYGDAASVSPVLYYTYPAKVQLVRIPAGRAASVTFDTAVEASGTVDVPYEEPLAFSVRAAENTGSPLAAALTTSGRELSVASMPVDRTLVLTVAATAMSIGEYDSSRVEPRFVVRLEDAAE
ncbi:MAG: hypothetical protein HYV63_18220 [Candidatus Schekmanbacteria bacterium]|nr:hypothetical protein [Candidatus Schekmanbacteria bacterium]